MKWTKILPDGKGGYNVFKDWSLGDDAMMVIWPIILKVAIGFLMSLFLPAILWVLIPLEYTKQNVEHTIVSLIVSLLFFLDYWFGGIIWHLFVSSQNLTAYHFFGALHIVFVLINVIRLYLYLYKGVEVSPVIIFAVAIGLMYFKYDGLTKAAENMRSETPMSFIADVHNEYMEEVLSNPYND